MKDWWRCSTTSSNSIATIVKHLWGNMISRWTDFLTADGEKPTRDRDAEFEKASQESRGDSGLWDAGWKCVFHGAATLQDADLTKRSRFAARSIRDAGDQSQAAHYNYHWDKSCSGKTLCGRELEVVDRSEKQIKRIHAERGCCRKSQR